jgi:hypothetical protein
VAAFEGRLNGWLAGVAACEALFGTIAWLVINAESECAALE